MQQTTRCMLLPVYCVVVLLLAATLPAPTEGYVYGWSSPAGASRIFQPSTKVEFSLRSNGSDLTLMFNQSLKGAPVNVSICGSPACADQVYYHRVFTTQSNETTTYSLLNVVPPFVSSVLVVKTTDGEDFSIGFPANAAAGTFYFSAIVDSKSLRLSSTNINYRCTYTTPSEVNDPIFVVAVPPTSLGFWQCVIPATFNAPAYPEYTPFKMEVLQYGDAPTPRLLPSLSGNVTYYTGAVVVLMSFSGCIGSNATFKGQFSMKNQYSCIFTPINPATPFTYPTDSQTVICQIPRVDGPIQVTAVSLLENAGPTTRVIYQDDDVNTLPKIRTCSGDGGDGDDDVAGLPYWAWIIIGVGAFAVVAVIVLIIVVVVVRKLRQPGYTNLN